MKKLSIILVCTFTLSNFLGAQQLFSYLASYRDVALYGFADSSGNTRTPGKYNLIMLPIDGICKVWAGQRSSNDYLNIKTGYCLTDGRELVSPQYSKGDDFSEGLAMVGMGDYLSGFKLGYINKQGAIQIPLTFRDAKSFFEGFAAVSTADKEWKYIDKTGAVKIAGPFLDAEAFSEGLACVSVPYDMGYGVKSFKRGYIDVTGKMVIGPEYIYGTPFKGGYAVVTVTDTSKSNYKTYQALIDRKGKRITTQQFISIHPANEGLWTVKIKGAIGLAKEKDEWGFIDNKGILLAPRFPTQPFITEGLVSFQKDSLYGFMDKHGKVIIEPAYKRANGFMEGMAAVQVKDGLWGFINKKGEMLIKPAYTSTSYFSDGVCVVFNGKSAYDNTRLDGVIDKTGKLIIPFEERAIHSFKNGRAVVEENGISYYLYKNGSTSLACNAKAMQNVRYGYNAIARNDVKVAMDYLGKPENKGCKISDYWLGYIYLQVTPPMKDSIKGAQLIEQAANAGYPDAMYSIAYVYAYGLSGKKDEALAKQWLAKAIKANVPAAYTLLGSLNEKTNPEEAAKLFKKGAELLEPIAMYNLALLYRDGRGVAKSEPEFNSWLNMAARWQYQPAKDLQASIMQKK